VQIIPCKEIIYKVKFLLTGIYKGNRGLIRG